jgi:Leucine-rich repeat (LRR) protein
MEKAMESSYEYLERIYKLQLSISEVRKNPEQFFAIIFQNTVRNGDLDKIKFYLSKGFSPKWIDADNNSYWKWNLFENIISKNEEEVKQLLWNEGGGYAHSGIKIDKYDSYNGFGEPIKESVKEWRNKNPFASVANFSNRDDITDTDFSYFWGIEVLNISNCPNITGDNFVSLQNIHTLDISNNPQINNVSSFRYLKGIHTLYMSGCPGISDMVFIFLKGICELDISNNPQITDKGFAFLKGLYSLRMKNCNQITNNVSKYLSSVCILDIDKCNNFYMTEDALSCLKNLKMITISPNNNHDKNIMPSLRNQCSFIYGNSE